LIHKELDDLNKTAIFLCFNILASNSAEHNIVHQTSE